MKRVLVVGIMILASAALSYAGPADTQPVNWFGPSCGPAPSTRDGFLLPTPAASVRGANPRLMVTQRALRGTLSMHEAPTTGQPQGTPKHQKSWFGRNWWWVIPVGVVVTWVVGVGVYCSSNPSMCDD